MKEKSQRGRVEKEQGNMYGGKEKHERVKEDFKKSETCGSF